MTWADIGALVTLPHVLDVLSVSVSLSLKVFGFPAQLRKGQTAMVFSAGMFASYSLAVGQLLIYHDVPAAVSQAIGAVLSAVLVLQGWRRQQAGEPGEGGKDRVTSG